MDSVFNISRNIKLIAKNSVFESLDFSRAVFIDTETTGLAGCGTLAFLIGVGFLKAMILKSPSILSVIMMKKLQLYTV